MSGWGKSKNAKRVDSCIWHLRVHTIRNSLQSVPSEPIILFFFCKNFKTHPTEHQYECFQVTYPSYKKE